MGRICGGCLGAWCLALTSALTAHTAGLTLAIEDWGWDKQGRLRLDPTILLLLSDSESDCPAEVYRVFLYQWKKLIG